MEFWGVEVKAGKPVKVTPYEDALIHISQASLGETKHKKGGESVPLFVKIGDKKLVLGTLSQEKFPQIRFDLVFEKEFELSHNWKNGSVYFVGYRSPNVDGQYPLGPGKVPAAITENVKNAKADADEVEAQPKAKASEEEKNVKPESEDDDFESEEDVEPPRKKRTSSKTPVVFFKRLSEQPILKSGGPSNKYTVSKPFTIKETPLADSDSDST